MPIAAQNGTVDKKPSIHQQLKIKVGATKRLLKEHGLYGKEAEVQKRKLDELIAENAEEWDIKHARRILEESQRMIKDSDDRLGKAVQELRSIVSSVKNNPEFEHDEELMKAEEALEEASV
ncbi:hypothetical protein SCLCIDRAFT_101315 [Scleroderma citrinum Foug A]|uniref:Tubulin-specific chaperone A n=1 Tax=Scleroderma citrinum Foug A TaxID=1036808 RepID=A0A0C3A8W6_9AGAM|nr:hypothetical protein SCLCIDRAFT_101315 [Scleroderma citrinum Foug A]